MNKPENNTRHHWRFFRSGGCDQVLIDKVDDLRHLGSLDQKLWSVLACPSKGLEYDTRTLQLLDSDDDGHIRATELIAAADWLCAVLKEAEVLFEGSDGLALAAIDAEHEEGSRLLATARKVLKYVGRADGESIAVADFADQSLLFAADHPNGDGVVPAALTADERLVELIGLIIEHFGAAADRSGEPGVDEERVTAFFAAAAEVLRWYEQAEEGAESVLLLGADTAAAADALAAVRDKVEDFFTRCRLAAFDERAATALNPADATYEELTAHELGADDAGVAALPLARIAADRELPLEDGLNPAWQGRILALQEKVVTPLLGARSSLGFEQWQELVQRFDAYRSWLAQKPAHPVADVDAAQLRALVQGNAQAELLALIEKDLTAETAAAQVDALERLVRYKRDFVTLLRNFVNLSDFYNIERKAIFQAGTLYLDQRSCDLCMRVLDVERHVALAPLSATYLVYCECRRHDEKPINIVAALTGGDVDEMMVAGRNGLFYDRAGRDWSATVIQVVEAPVSVSQAFWSPYKRIGRMISEQIQKFAASRDSAVDSKAAGIIADTEATGATPAPAPAFDIAKFAGIFAAIGLALGALGTALAAVVSGFLSLPAWQMPLVIVGIVALISGPSMLLAWFKLRQRNLGPLLDANGWAVNTRARINIPFGGALTAVAQLPAGSAHSRTDPFAEKKSPWKSWLVLIIFIIAAIVLWREGVYERLFTPPAVETSAVAGAAAEEGADEAGAAEEAAADE